ncbi:hypothetical protein HIC20_02875 [Buchnera aphidicola (Hormaphis cornu)]|nr:hypothetical protein HIC20_02875 [Buchnera aphidicola (Hormaphis cornu)]
MTATKIIELLENEHPQIITTILIYLEHDKRLEILSLLPDNIILEVILRIASFSKLNDVATLEFFNIINVLLVSKNKKSNSAYKDCSNIRKGIDLAVTLLNSLKKNN